jgi:hypothetical protein
LEQVPKACVTNGSGAEIEALLTEQHIKSKQITRNVEAIKDFLRRDQDRITAKLGSMQYWLDQLTKKVDEVQVETGLWMLMWR